MTTTLTTTDTATPTPKTYQLADYIDCVRDEGERFAAAAQTASLDADISSCPGWSMRDLVRHLGEVHLWAAANVTTPRNKWLFVADLDDLAPYWPELATRAPHDSELLSWYRATHRNLIHVLETAPLDVPALCFLPAPSPLTMWARRQAHEIAVHRYDAEQAQGIVSHYDAHFAADMLDELVVGFTRHMHVETCESERVLLVHAIDVDVRWWLTIGPDGVRTSSSGEHDDLTVAGTAAQLSLLLWNRAPAGEVRLSGDASVIDLWQRSCRIEWLR